MKGSRSLQTDLLLHNNSVKKAKVGVVLLNWNGGEFTIPCIESLLDGTVKPDRIVVVDNASKDGSPDKIALKFPEVELIRNTFNNGFAGGNNQGIQLLLNEDADYIWILNNDTIIAKNCLEILLEIARNHPVAAGLSGKIFYDEPKNRVWYAGAYRHPLHLGAKHISVSALDKNTNNGAAKVPFISGCSMFVPSWAWQRYGGFIEAYIAYSEDNEWCWRVTNDRGMLLYVPEAVIWHKLSVSIQKNLNKDARSNISPKILYLMSRNQFWTIRKHATGTTKWFSLAVNIGIQFRNMFLWAIKNDLKLFIANAKGMAVGLFRQIPTAHSFLGHK